MSTIKERPILMSAPMVLGILNGSKTQTRRGTGLDFVNMYPNLWERQWIPDAKGAHWLFTGKDITPKQVRCPYGVEGERLWVRETWGTAVECVETDSGCFEGDFYTVYRAGKGPAGTPRDGWKPSIHMRRSDSRILLEIVSVRVERLQDITEADAVAEGIETMPHFPDRYRLYGEAADSITPWAWEAKESYRTLWNTINGLHGPKSWDANPWVWVVEFKRIDA